MGVPEFDLRMLGVAGSGENEAREALLRQLPMECVVSQTIDREEGDSLAITFPEGTFAVSAPRLRLAWHPAPPADETRVGFREAWRAFWRRRRPLDRLDAILLVAVLVGVVAAGSNAGWW